MSQAIETITVTSTTKEELIDITGLVEEVIARSIVHDGACIVYTPHTTAAITINENADPAVVRDLLLGMRHWGLEKLSFAHGEGNSPAHVKSSIIGCSVTVLVDRGRLILGRWQGIFFCEFDGPRSRQVMIRIL